MSLADVRDVAAAADARERAAVGNKPAVVSNPQLEKDALARALHSRLVRPSPGGRARQTWGRVHCRGGGFRPVYFQVTYSDRSCAFPNHADLLAAHNLLPVRAKLPKGTRVPRAADANPSREGPDALGGDPTLPAV